MPREGGFQRFMLCDDYIHTFIFIFIFALVAAFHIVTGFDSFFGRSYFFILADC
jgi:hypothetical protein